MKQFIVVIPLLLLVTACVPISTSGTSSSSDVRYVDRNYTEDVGNVRVTTALPSPGYENRIVSRSASQSLQITFDLIRNEYSYLYLKMIHCNRDWQPSGLSDLDYLDEYNEFNVTDYEFSQNNYSPFVSYFMRLPTLKKSGNYIIAVYDDNTDSPLFTRRIVMYDGLAGINADLQPSMNPATKRSHHQIDFGYSYGGLNVSDPVKDLQPVLLQNRNWNTAIMDLKPTDIQLDRQYLEYAPFTGENLFPGLNNFRYFDIRSLSFQGQNVQRIGRSERGVEAYIEDEPTTGKFFSEAFETDLNGGYYTRNIDPNSKDLNSEYVWVNFTLNSAPVDANIYVVGKWNDWQLTSQYKLSYITARNAYQGSVRLKQGFYNYQYYVQGTGIPYYILEGSFFESKNGYEILLYFREPGTIYDQVVGYTRF